MEYDNVMEQAILSYLARHPEAKDTFEGIAEWWILKENINRSVDDIKEAINHLISKGYIVVKEYPNQNRIYQINQEKLQDYKKKNSSNE